MQRDVNAFEPIGRRRTIKRAPPIDTPIKSSCFGGAAEWLIANRLS
jgi:hypothetical protein